MRFALKDKLAAHEGERAAGGTRDQLAVDHLKAREPLAGRKRREALKTLSDVEPPRLFWRLFHPPISHEAALKSIDSSGVFAMLLALRRRGLRAVRIAGASASQAGAIPVQASRRAAAASDMSTKRRFPLHVALMCSFLAACATRTPPATLPVSVSCVPANTPAKPLTRSPEDLAKLSDPEFVIAVSADYLALFAWSLKAEPTIEGCRKAAQ